MRTYTCDRCGKSDNSHNPDIRIYTTSYMQLTHPGYGGAPDWSIAKLSEIERQLAGRPMPGSLKPSQPKPKSRPSTSTVQLVPEPEPEPSTPQVSDSSPLDPNI